MSFAAQQTIESVEMPQVGTWQIDASHSRIGFAARHLMVSKVRGGFTSYDGTVRIGPTPDDSSVEVSIDAASIDTGDAQRDAHLRSPDFLDAENHPQLTFRSTAVIPTGATTGKVRGDLTIRGITREVELDVEFEGIVRDPWGNQRIGVTARGEIDREAFGLTWNVALEAGGVLVGKKVQLEIEAQAVLQA